jgi:DNA helicase HerA-like ATPase
MLDMARSDKFRECPLLLFLDEAHNFLNKTLGDEDTRYSLDSFDLIAKEGRKLSLNICISTQRPRDIPEGILSQMGTLIIHRLRNDQDRELVERASSDAERSAMTLVPELGDGQAVIVGVGFPISLPVQVTRPTQPPDSHGPDFQTQWQQQ